MENFVMNSLKCYNFGYGSYGSECYKINKLNLRNKKDLKIYIKEILKTNFIAKNKEFKILTNDEKIQVIVK